MVRNDDRSWLDDVRLGYVHRPRRVKHLFYLWCQFGKWRHRRPFPEFSGSLAERQALDEACRRRGARLAVVIFRDAPFLGEWAELVRAVSEGLRGTRIPVRDLGLALLREHGVADLMAHPVDDHAKRDRASPRSE